MAGNVKVVIDPLTHRTTYAYDVLDRVETITDAEGTTHPGDGWTRLVVTPQSFVGEVLRAVSMERSVAIDPDLEEALSAVRDGGASNGS